MTDKELHKLGRKELLQLLVAQSREADNARQKLAETQEELGQLQETYERLRGKLNDKDTQIRKLREIIRQERQAFGIPADGAVPEEQTGVLPTAPAPKAPVEAYPERVAYPASEQEGRAAGYHTHGYDTPYVEPHNPYDGGRAVPPPRPLGYAPAAGPVAPPYWNEAAAHYRGAPPEASWQQKVPYTQYPAPGVSVPQPPAAPFFPYSGEAFPAYDLWKYPPGYGGELREPPAQPCQHTVPKEEIAMPRPPASEKRKERVGETPGKFPESLVNPLSLPVVGSLRGPSEGARAEVPLPASEDSSLFDKAWWQAPAAETPGRAENSKASQEELPKQAAEPPVPSPTPAPKASPIRRPQQPPKPETPAQKNDVQVLRVVNGKIMGLD